MDIILTLIILLLFPITLIGMFIDSNKTFLAILIISPILAILCAIVEEF